ncbi:serine/threonine protein phosphatase [Oryzomonas japonica]|uniref:Serine/threonine protein phosphatase n=1 Tax=Oryzomonas japonica TaxID=2603858 RepID=A0A7J4ZRA4_9BACT|nr:metallophosphoesterase family protein [Oryzomonas japonica]KAB0665710.1 serine/threonine protein phosphatase [Oryzomonas japonica]
MSRRVFVIGDVHGCARTLRELVIRGVRLTPSDTLYLLGDLIDRGPDSKGVLDFIFELTAAGYNVASVQGNHEEMCLRAPYGRPAMDMWTSNGGLTTLASFLADGPGDIPHRYLQYLGSLPPYILLDHFVIVHAGLNFDREPPFGPLDDTEAMLWTRSDVVERQRIGGRRLICGHTMVTRQRLEASLKSDKIMLDNGCVTARFPDMGYLAALELNSMRVVFQENIDQ